MAMGKQQVPPTEGAGRRHSLPGRIGRAAIAATALVVLLAGTPVAADPAAPDELEVLSVYVARNVYETGDYILAFHYNIDYPTVPSVPANRLFHFRLLDTDGVTVLGATSPYAYNSGGYYEGAGGFYFGPSEAPTWEEPVVFQIRGNPEYWTSPPEENYILTFSDYSQLDTQQENQTLLGNYIIDVAISIEIDWNFQMVTETEMGAVLSGTGETYFTGTISGLRVMAPDIFAVTTSNPDYTSPGYGTDRADEYASRWEGTWVEDALVGIEDLGFDRMLVTGFATILLIGLMYAISYAFWGTTDPALNAGIIVFFMSYLLGFVAPAVMAITTLLAAIYIVYIWMFRHG